MGCTCMFFWFHNLELLLSADIFVSDSDGCCAGQVPATSLPAPHGPSAACEAVLLALVGFSFHPSRKNILKTHARTHAHNARTCREGGRTEEWMLSVDNLFVFRTGVLKGNITESSPMLCDIFRSTKYTKHHLNIYFQG